jgi:ubiquinone/menaquinone biosynthesis C-methylase UbiE
LTTPLRGSTSCSEVLKPQHIFMKTEIDINTAKEELGKINALLSTGHLLIGGLAVQQYYKTRTTSDIDLVCENPTARKIIDKLYPSKDYVIDEKNDDEYRPSFIITHKINRNRIVFFGPKITERESYTAVDWEKLLSESHPFHYRNVKYENIRVPTIEALAFTKLLAFVDRAKTNRDKAQNDLIDFIELTNDNAFQINLLTNQIRESRTEKYIRDGMIRATENYDTNLWESSLLMDLKAIIFPPNNSAKGAQSTFEDNYDKIYKTEQCIEFYDRIAERYDERNTKVVLRTHRKVIAAIKAKRRNVEKLRVLDIGSGTGRQIAHQYYASENIQWHCIEPSDNMARQFRENMQGTQAEITSQAQSIFDFKASTESKYDVVIVSLVLSSLPRDPDFGEISKCLAKGGVLIITDFYESGQYYNFDIDNQKIALFTRRIDFMDTLKSLLLTGLRLLSLDTIDNPAGLENTFIMELSRDV